MEWVETTGRTIEEAKKAALEQLGVEEADADFEVLAEPKLGLFGRLREEARVRARVQPRYPRSKVDRRDRRRSRAGQAERQQAEHAPAAERPKEATADTAAAAPTVREQPARGRARPNSEGAGSARRRPRSSSATPADTGTGPGDSVEDVSVPATEDQAQLAEAFLRGLVVELGATATVSSHSLGDGIVEVELHGDGLATLIGPKGSTLAALQELTRTVLQRQTSADGRIVVDVNGYRKKRADALARFALEVAEEVKASGAKRALEPMPPADRKVVHDAVNSLPGVRTISEGEEPYRRVVLLPEDSAADGDPQVTEPAAS